MKLQRKSLQDVKDAQAAAEKAQTAADNCNKLKGEDEQGAEYGAKRQQNCKQSFFHSLSYFLL